MQGQKFDLIIICLVLEHSSRPWVLAHNIQNALSDTETVYPCHPWVWRYHKYRDDYFRFSPKGIQVMFDQLNCWLPSLFSTYREGEILSFTQDDGIGNTMFIMDDQGASNFRICTP